MHTSLRALALASMLGVSAFAGAAFAQNNPMVGGAAMYADKNRYFLHEAYLFGKGKMLEVDGLESIRLDQCNYLLFVDDIPSTRKRPRNIDAPLAGLETRISLGDLIDDLVEKVRGRPPIGDAGCQNGISQQDVASFGKEIDLREPERDERVDVRRVFP